MKTILCFGDSLTWGYKPENGTRYPYEQRWTTLLQNALGQGHRVVEEGLNGRTPAFDTSFRADRNGAKVLPCYWNLTLRWI